MGLLNLVGYFVGMSDPKQASCGKTQRLQVCTKIHVLVRYDLRAGTDVASTLDITVIRTKFSA
eukprot:SAG31_NODE_1389_length_8545_cov_3.081103_4_plen_63_part_00